jgi:hypothetical protein
LSVRCYYEWCRERGRQLARLASAGGVSAGDGARAPAPPEL